MVLETVYKVFVFTGPGLDVLLCVSMFVKGRWRDYPALLLLTSFDLLSAVALYLTDPTGYSRSYAHLYLAFDVASFLLQAWLLYEIAGNVLRPAGIWSRAAMKPLLLAGGSGAVLALIASMYLRPSGLHGPQALQLQAEVFTGLITCELVIAMMLSAKEVGLAWRSHIMAIGQGLMLYQLVTVSVQGFAAYLGPHDPYYQSLYFLRGITYLITVGYWTVSLWREEPARKPISPAFRKYIVALHDRVQYDLGK